MRANSACARSAPAFAFCTSGTAFTSISPPPVMPSRASSCAAFACASFNCASVSVDEIRMSSDPSDTADPRSMFADTTPGRLRRDVACSLGHQIRSRE
jgi:hypothetical protein